MVEIDNLIRQTKIQLGIQLKQKFKVYLDINFWIRMRECLKGSPKNSKYMKLFELLVESVSNEKAICPVSQRIYSELLKQTDYESRINSARVMDKLSQGITILSEPEREQTEFFYYVRNKILKQENVFSPDEYVWSKVAFVLGTFIPENEKLPKKILEKMQSDIFNYLVEVTLEEIIDKIGDNIPFHLLNRDKSTIAINLGKMLANENIRSIEQLFIDETRGALSVYKNTVEDFFIYYKNANPSLMSSLIKHSIKNSDDMMQAIFIDIKDKTLNNYLPSLYIQICLHTLMRWDKKREFKSNDFEDFAHASSALPYYDCFFTEKPLTVLLKSGPFNLNKKYSKIVHYNISDAIQTIQKYAS